MDAVKLTKAQHAALEMFTHTHMFERDVCTARIGKQLAAMNLVDRVTGGKRVVLRLLDVGRAALIDANHCHNGLHCLSPESCICLCKGCERKVTFTGRAALKGSE